nr:hypothetical protein [Lachnospiraceae bacterium]
ENWNMVMVGDDPDGLPTGTWPAKAYTEVAEADIVQDKPLFLWTDPKTRENMGIYVPAKRAHAVATSWNTAKDLKAEDYEPAPVVTDLSLFPENLGHISPMDDWYIAHAGQDTAKSLNRALENGRHLLFTPGIYYLEEPLQVQQNGRILLGLGLATLRPTKGNICVETRADDLILAGLLLDAGSAYIPVNGTDSAEKSLGEPVISPNLLVVGKGKNVSLNDLYFRVGGCDTQEPAQATCCITIDADRVIGDNLWVWRADHGDQVAWDKNVTKNGIVINGDDAVMYALMVEHFHEYQTIWRGNGGRLYMYQSEIPYDVPSNEVWMSREGTRAGYASLFIDDETESFHGEGIGIYLYNRDAPVLLESAMEMPDKEGVSVHHIITVMLNGNPGMHHVINDAGNAVMTRGAEAMLLDYEKGEYR